MKISVTVKPAILEIQDVELSSKTATEVREIAHEHISLWLKSEAQVDWQIIAENELAVKAA